jgi:superoxide dismutase, Fe-Mn family
MANTLPPLDYPYDALEPYISQQIMTLHHTKHHQTYVNALNAAEASYAKASTPKERIALQAALKFNGGGKYRSSQ